MNEYIKREAALALVQLDAPDDEKAAVTIATAKKLVRSIVRRTPAADVAPVVHGRWVPNCVDGPAFFVCDQCNTVWYNATKFCPNCGAKMDGEVTRRMTDKELIRALRGAQSRSKRALLDEAADRILNYAVNFACPTPDLYQAKCGSMPEAGDKCRACWEKYIADEEE